MMLRMQGLEALAGDMSINLGSGNIRMAQQHLNHPKVRAVVEQMRGKGVPDHMR